VEGDNENNAMLDTEKPKPRNFFSRLAGVFSSPRVAFLEIGQNPRVFLPFVCLIVLGLLAGFYLSRTLDLESATVSQMQMLVERGAMTKEQMEQRLPMAIKSAGIQLIALTTLGSILGALIIAGFAKLFSLMVAAENRFKSLFSVTVYVMLVVSIVQYALTILVLQLKGAEEVDLAQLNSVVASNLGAILSSVWGNDVLPKFLMSLANGVDVFAIWIIALLAIGYSAVSRKLKTSTAAIWLVGAYLVLIVIGAAVSSIFAMPGSR
jgi:hypothetical protein